jgi:pimeloyl-ACP methyl ester carboxylesterase
MARVAANGLSIGYDEHGRDERGRDERGADASGRDSRDARPALVMLHGATSSGREDWAAQIPLLARSFRVILPDARGHATTPWDASEGWSSERLVDDLAAFLDARDIGVVHLAGFSMGAHTALGFAARAPGRVASLVLAGISLEPEPRGSVARRLMDPERIDRTDPGWAAQLAARHDPFQGVGAWRRLLPAIAAEISHARTVTPREIHAISAPALVVVGDRDPFAPVDHAWAVARLLRGGGLFVVPDCPHEAMVRRPALVNEALRGFYHAILSP